MSAWPVDILTYHSLSDGDGPTCISPRIFREQMAVLADLGYRGISLRDFAGWSGGDGPGRVVILTFDDGFEDFATVAFPELEAHGWGATVFLPAGRVGGTDDWERGGKGHRPQRLLTWETVQELARRGVEFGGHGVTHADLTTLGGEALRAEVAGSKRLIETRGGCRVTSFALPYGRTSGPVRSELRRWYHLAVGTSLSRARATSDVYDLPRLEMWYFRDPRRWRAYLQRGSTAYFVARRALRGLAGLVR
jgi:peptidoglycan/xylan/chitin deacetylase (PgdA/CDA1 family)